MKIILIAEVYIYCFDGCEKFTTSLACPKITFKIVKKSHFIIVVTKFKVIYVFYE